MSDKIEKFSKNVRRKIIETAYEAGSSSAHIGGALSSVEIVSTLFGELMNFNQINYQDQNRDRFILSKGHACLVYYCALSELGIISVEKLKTFEKPESDLLGHPVKNKQIGIDFSTGSLGMGMSLGVGVALGCRKKKISNKVYVLVGDGECNEGSVWEAAMSAAHYDLNQLTVIIDRNNFQQTGKSDEIMSYKNLKNIWSSFGFLALEVNGHNINELTNAFNTTDKKKPKVIIANTIKGKGLSFMENDNNWHHSILTSKLYEKAMEELK